MTTGNEELVHAVDVLIETYDSGLIYDAVHISQLISLREALTEQSVPVMGEPVYQTRHPQWTDKDRWHDCRLDEAEHLESIGMQVRCLIGKPTNSITAAELARLRDVEKLADGLGMEAIGLHEQIAELTAELEQLRKDAERDRWIRTIANDAIAIELIDRYCETDLDREIDAAIAAGKNGEGKL